MVCADHALDWQKLEHGCRWLGPLGDLPVVRVAHVYDGDTVRLADGRRLRLLGINTPELARDGRPAQLFAAETKELVVDSLAHGQWRLLSGHRDQDRHGRQLGYLLDHRGISLGSVLVDRGAAMWVAKAPDVGHVACMKSLERGAQMRQAGLWAGEAWRSTRARDVSSEALGFQLLHGKITRVDAGRSGRHSYVELDDHLVLRLSPDIAADTDRWLGRELRVRGWLVQRQLSPGQRQKGFKAFLMTVSSRQAIDLAP
ncbi:MAG: thermonuclease family protein [Candidatus Pelagadaptatus aseana]